MASSSLRHAEYSRALNVDADGCAHPDPDDSVDDGVAASAFVLDLFFTFNIAISVLVLLVAVNTQKPLDFSVFPTVLLVTTLLRLSLNVASTRVVCSKGIPGRIRPVR
jgi:hypothetical protein